MRLLILAHLIIILPNMLYAQSRKERLRHSADAYYKMGEYARAIEYYKRCLNKEVNADVYRNLAYCYKHTSDTRQAEYWFQKYFSVKKVKDNSLRDYGLVLKENGRYTQAKAVFSEYKLLSGDSLAPQLIASCDSAIKWNSSPGPYTVRNLKKINSPYSDISPFLYGDGLVFSSSRERTIIRRKTGDMLDPYYDIYFARQRTENDFSVPVIFSYRINSPGHDAAACFNKQQSKIYFTRSYSEQPNKVKDSVNRLKLYSSEKKGNDWSTPEKFIFNDSSVASYAHPNISHDEKMFFFVSDMQGGFGGTDIYVCLRIDSAWTTPINLGPYVNTAGNETFPFYHEDGTLYFSSDGHPGFGGYDIYSAHQKGGDWKIVKNMKAPINSSADDLSIYLSKEKNVGFFSSNRAGGTGKEDIYRIFIK